VNWKALSRPRALIIVLGIVFLVMALVAGGFDPFIAMGMFVVGSFLLVLPFLAEHDEDD